MMSDILVWPVNTKKDLKKFIRFPNDLYQDDPNYVQPLMMERLDSLQAHKNPYFDHAEVQFWLATKDDKIVGRISAQVCELVKENIDPKLGQFGMFECIDDQEVADALLVTALDWLKERGMDKVHGPYNLSVNMETGLLVDGFDTPPMIMMGHGKPYYESLLEKYGFKGVKNLYAYHGPVKDMCPPKVQKLYEMAQNNDKLVLHKMNMSKMEEELKTYFDIFNESWSDNWGFVPFTDAEGVHAAKSMKPLLNKHRCTWVEYKGEPAGFMIALPDINEYIKDLKGGENIFNLIRLGWRLLTRKPKSYRVPLMGIRKKYQGKAIGALMTVMMTETCRQNAIENGLEYGELSWILEDNKGMISILENINSVPYKTYRLYEKAID